MKKKKILITGVAGFIGSHLADRLLAHGHQIIGLDNLAYGRREHISPKVEFHKIDIRSPKIYPLFKNVSHVFHLAAKNVLGDCQRDPVETADINVTGTVTVFEAARRAGAARVVYAESSAVYEGIATMPVNEKKVAPHSFYAVSKACDNLFAAAYRNYFNLPLVGLRYFNVYGPRQNHRRTIVPIMSEYIIKLLKKERPIIYGSPKKRRDYIHIDDVNDFHELCVTGKDIDGSVVNVGSGHSYSFIEIYKKISDIIGIDIPPDFREDLPGAALETKADISLARSMGWRPRVSLEKGLRTMVDYIKRELKL